MKDLSEVSGLPLKLDVHSNCLVMEEDLPQVEPVPRMLEEMRGVLYDRSAPGPEVVYLMYRGVCLPEHEELLKKHRLRYDVVVMPPGKIGREFVKTRGHIHERVPGLKDTFPEVYLVLSGVAHYFLQRVDYSLVHGRARVEDAVLIVAEAGDKVIIPPNYGHVTINAQRETLVTANWVGTNFSSSYAPLEEYQGAAYYMVEEKGVIRFLRNDLYARVPQLREVPVNRLSPFGFSREKPAYQTVVENPDKFKYLTEPREYLKELKAALVE